ncbi:MAG: efflux RND transporter periplasmic adaptor subunit [Candidatus Sericytochromatia bacterium]|nr:efflux RND transporter periplasmic adaptor subunit [Candidatus Sericytochromatia bacterium]
MNRRLLIVAALVPLLGTAGWMLRPRAERGGEADVVTVARGDLKVDLAETGTVQPLVKVDIKSRIAGQVARLDVDAGSRVRKGDVLMALDITDMERNRAQARADLAAAQARLDRLTAGPRPEEIAASRAEVRVAEAELARAHDEAQRSRAAAQTQTLTPRELDMAQRDLDTARARRDGATARLAMLAKGSRAEDLREARAQRDRMAVALASAEDQLRYATLRSPLDGVVIRRGIEVGEMVSPGVSALAQGNAILTVADLRRLIVQSNVGQVDVGRLRVGMPVTVRVDALGDVSLEGRIHRIAPAAEALKDGLQTFAVDTLVTGPGTERLKPGMTADLDVHVAIRQNVLLLPVEALLDRKGGRARVQLAMADGKSRKGKQRDIRIGMSSDSEIEVISGLEEGARVRIAPPGVDNALKM